MGAYLSDRLFVALAKKVGFPDKPTLTTYRSLQLEFVRSGMPVTLFTLTKLKGVLDERQADQFVAWARQVAAARPTYNHDLRETGARRALQEATDGVVEVRPTWKSDETADVDSVEIDVAAEALDPSKDHTEELMRLLDDMSVEEVASRSRRALGVSASSSRFDSGDMLPTLGQADTVDPLDALVSGYVGGSHEVQVEVVESGSLFDDSGIAPSPFVHAPAAQRESHVDDLLESRVDALDPHHESHVDLFEDAHPSADDCLALFDDEPAAQKPIEDMDTDVIDVVEDPLLDLLPEWEVEEEAEAEAEMPADSALFDVLSWDEVSDQIDALEADAGLDLDIVDPWADPPTTAAPELPRQAATIVQPALGPTNAKASAEFRGDPAGLLESGSSFDPWGSSFDSVKEPSLYDQLKSDSGTRAGYQPAGAGAAPPPPPPLAPLPNHFAA